VAELIKDMNAEFPVRQFGRVITMDKAEGLVVPALASRLTSVSRTEELKTGSLETLDFEQRRLYPKPLAGRMVVSNTMLRKSVLDPEQIIRDEFLNASSVTLETEYMSGTGASEGLGIFVEDAMGIGADRDITTAATGAISIDDLHSVVGGLSPRYRRKCRWIMGPGTEEYLKKRKDGEGRYMIQADLTAGTPLKLLGYPLTISEFCPDSITSGEYVLALADFSYYWIADSLQAQIKRLDELYAESDSTGFILRIETDSMPMLAEAFVRLKVK
jgi:HK97 family phage major capsid protein